MDTWALIGLITFAGGAAWLIHLIRTMPGNEDSEYGDDFDGSGSAFGYPPLDDKPKKSPKDLNHSN